MYINIAILSKTVNLTLQIFEVKPKSEEIVHFYLAFLKFSMCFFDENCNVLF